jgi:3alpha(or 20beta)-hydroxysteroid dehydrogenase
MTGRLHGKVAIITGAASGIGEATARLFAREGAAVTIADRSADQGQTVAADIGASATFQRHDVADEESWATLVEATLARSERIDILVNNAGILRHALLKDMSRADFDGLFAINVTGVFLGMKAVASAMIAQRAGAIVNMSSTGGFRATNATGAYTASKFAVRGLTRTAALELGPLGIRVNSVHPGWVVTPLTNPAGIDPAKLDKGAGEVPLQRAGRPEDIAEACLYLASDAAAYCTGTELLVDGGHMAGRYLMREGAPEAVLRRMDRS